MNVRRLLRQHGPRLRRGLVITVALAAYLTSALGIPLPVPTAQDVSQPFPCQGHACGCRSADQCWQQCCCYSPEEKLSWAKDHHVEPPAHVNQEAADGWNAPRLRDQEPAKKSCCSAHAETNRHEQSAAPTCEKTNWVMGMSARHCQGLGELWTALAAALPPPAVVQWNYDWSGDSWLQSADAVLLCLSSAPTSPPPRS
ncbi:MAG: hypothetical protein K2R98_03205 [Gemmataceae bacterium]|nr:hypothetical protein [Gemmataceae bacterium]